MLSWNGISNAPGRGSSRRFPVGFVVIATLAALLHPGRGAAPLPPAPKDLAAPAIREISPGKLLVGPVQLDRTERSVSFPARLNMTNGLVEYVLVHQTGKTHESLLVTDIEPYHLQVALLLLGARGATTAQLTNAPAGGPIPNAELLRLRPPPVPGHPVRITARWKTGTTNVTHLIEQLILHQKTRRPMSPGRWTFSGSMIWNGRFIAHEEGSIVSIITDISAMFNNPRDDRDADSTWFVNEPLAPPENTPVMITITLEEAASSSPTLKPDPAP